MDDAFLGMKPLSIIDSIKEEQRRLAGPLIVPPSPEMLEKFRLQDKDDNSYPNEKVARAIVRDDMTANLDLRAVQRAAREAEKARGRGIVMPVEIERNPSTKEISITGNSETVKVMQRAFTDQMSKLYQSYRRMVPEFDFVKDPEIGPSAFETEYMTEFDKGEEGGDYSARVERTPDGKFAGTRLNRSANTEALAAKVIDGIFGGGYYEATKPVREKNQQKSAPMAPIASRRKIRLED